MASRRMVKLSTWARGSTKMSDSKKATKLARTIDNRTKFQSKELHALVAAAMSAERDVVRVWEERFDRGTQHTSKKLRVCWHLTASPSRKGNVSAVLSRLLREDQNGYFWHYNIALRVPSDTASRSTSDGDALAQEVVKALAMHLCHALRKACRVETCEWWQINVQWASDVRVSCKPAKAKPSTSERVAMRAQHALKMMQRAERDVMMAQARADKWQRKVKYYQGRGEL